MQYGLLLYRGLRRDGVLRHSAGWSSLLLQAIAANALMGLVILRLGRPLSWWLEAGSIERISWLAVIIAAGAATYFCVLFVLGLRPSRLGIKPH